MKLYLLLTILLSLFFVLTIVWHAIQIKKKNKSGSFMAVDLIFVMLILLGMLIVNKTFSDHDSLLDSTESDIYQKPTDEDTDNNQSDLSRSESDLVNNLISMQANTLSVTVTIVTISCIIISILTIYRERKAENNSQKVESSLKALEKTESVIQEIAAISSVLLLDDNQKDFFISIIKNEVERLSLNKEPLDIATAHFQMIMLNMILYNQYYIPKYVSETKKYDIIINSANEIIENERATRLSISFAYVERAHAAFQKLKASTETKDIEQIRINIKSVNEYVHFLKKIDDTSGNILNLRGLVELWSGIAKIRINDITKGGARFTSNNCLEHYKAALNYFEEAIKMNEHKKEFKNHRVVALLRISDVSENTYNLDCIDKAIKYCNDLKQEAPDYIKPYINCADAFARNIRIFLKPKYVWDNITERQIYDYSQLQPEHDLKKHKKSIAELRENALKELEKAIEIDQDFENSYYKRAEINLLWLGYNIWLYRECNVQVSLETMKNLCKDCETDLSKAIDRIGDTTKIDGYRASLNIIISQLKKNTINVKAPKSQMAKKVRN